MRSHTRQKIILSAGEYHVLNTPEKKNLPDDIWFSEQPPSSRASFFLAYVHVISLPFNYCVNVTGYIAAKG